MLQEQQPGGCGPLRGVFRQEPLSALPQVFCPLWMVVLAGKHEQEQGTGDPALRDPVCQSLL